MKNIDLMTISRITPNACHVGACGIVHTICYSYLKYVIERWYARHQTATARIMAALSSDSSHRSHIRNVFWHSLACVWNYVYKGGTSPYSSGVRSLVCIKCV